MKISKKNIYIFLLILLGALFLNIIIAKTNGLHNSRLIPKEATKFKIIPWEEVFQEWRLILFRSVGVVLIGYFLYFIASKKK